MPDPVAVAIIAECARKGYRVAVAESLTGGLLVSALIDVPGASAVVSGGVVAYDTAVKNTVLGVEASLLAERGAVDPGVAMAMAAGVRRVLSVDGIPATIGIATTGVAGPEPQDGHDVGTAFVGLAVESGAASVALQLAGSRAEIRKAVVDESLLELERLIDSLG